MDARREFAADWSSTTANEMQLEGTSRAWLRGGGRAPLRGGGYHSLRGGGRGPLRSATQTAVGRARETEREKESETRVRSCPRTLPKMDDDTTLLRKRVEYMRQRFFPLHIIIEIA